MAEGVATWEDAVRWLRAQPESRDLVEACFFDDPLSEAADRYWRSTEWAAVRRWIGNPPGRALDVGAGRGIASFALAKDGWMATALEPDPSDLVGAGAIRALAGEAGVAIDVVETWGETLPFESESFDVAHCRQVLHHAHDLGKFCAEVGRVLKPGGVMIATREHVISAESDLPEFLANHPLHKLYGGENAFLLEQYRSAITNAGLRLERVLNRLESDINLYPTTTQDVKRRIAGRLRLSPFLVPDFALKLAGSIGNLPGRLYTFVARKHAR